MAAALQVTKLHYYIVSFEQLRQLRELGNRLEDPAEDFMLLLARIEEQSVHLAQAMNPITSEITSFDPPFVAYRSNQVTPEEENI